MGPLNQGQHSLSSLDPLLSWRCRCKSLTSPALSLTASFIKEYNLGACSWESKDWGIRGQDSNSELLGNRRIKTWLHFQDTLKSGLLIALHLTFIKPLLGIWITTLCKGKSSSTQTKNASGCLAYHPLLSLHLTCLCPASLQQVYFTSSVISPHLSSGQKALLILLFFSSQSFLFTK